MPPLISPHEFVGVTITPGPAAKIFPTIKRTLPAHRRPKLDASAFITEGFSSTKTVSNEGCLEESFMLASSIYADSSIAGWGAVCSRGVPRPACPDLRRVVFSVRVFSCRSLLALLLFSLRRRNSLRRAEQQVCFHQRRLLGRRPPQHFPVARGGANASSPRNHPQALACRDNRWTAELSP